MQTHIRLLLRALPELQIRGGIEEISKVLFFLFLNENICCDPSLEPSQQDGSNDGSQYMFLWKNMDNYPETVPVTPSFLGPCSTSFPFHICIFWTYYCISNPTHSILQQLWFYSSSGVQIRTFKVTLQYIHVVFHQWQCGSSSVD